MASFQGNIDPDTWIAPNATVCGAVEIGPQTNIWFGAVVRGDLERIQIGRCCNVQDGAVLHCDGGEPTVLEDYVTIGHKAIVHSAYLERGCLIGMGAIVMNGVRIGAGSIVGAGAIVTKSVQPNTLAIGTPAKPRRSLSPEEASKLLHHAEEYWSLAIAHRQGQFPLLPRG
ncbi:gamma carbonic anhydrase family protein [Synechococcus sp. PCC 7336]|uniref:gamma carbonic anhydrase family protein n=1 Tax=Synechococcus sp. PCC 7336 TaxID=195250 RepID=UPI00034A10C1|nr:gamma carbonic anhydrase family protein [Synechococcus sp. PCC 7336]